MCPDKVLLCMHDSVSRMSSDFLIPVCCHKCACDVMILPPSPPSLSIKPIYCSCFLKFGKSGAQKGRFLGMVVFCKLAILSKIKEMVVGTFFKTKHSLDLSYTNVDTR